MKKNLIILISSILVLVSCSDPALDVEYGKPLIYMPQATHNLGTDCNLDVPLYESENNDTVVTLGIYRSGLQKLNEFSVTLSVNNDTINKAKAIASDPTSEDKYEMYKTAVMLSEEYYEPLPEILTVQQGKREETFGLTLRKEKILEDYNKGDILLLPIQISNPTLYEINDQLSLTMVMISVK